MKIYVENWKVGENTKSSKIRFKISGLTFQQLYAICEYIDFMRNRKGDKIFQDTWNKNEKLR